MSNPLILILRKHYIFIIILLVALFLRLYRIEYLTTFGRDQGIDFLTVRDMVLFHKWTLIGIKTSIGEFFQGPDYLYVLYPFFVLLRLNPLAGPIASVVVSVLTILLIYLTGIKFFSKKIALFAVSLFAFSPIFVTYGNTPLYQNFLPLFIVSSIYLYLRLENKRSLIISLLLGISVGIGLEFHLLNVILAASIFISLILRKHGLKIIAAYVIGMLLGVLPTLLFELRHNFLNTHLFLSQFGVGSRISFHIISVCKQIIDGLSIFFGGNSWVIGLLLLITTIVLLFFVKPKQNKYFSSLKLLFTITLIFSIIMTIKFAAFEPHYLLPLWMILIIFLPLSIDSFSFRKPAELFMVVLLFINLASTLKVLNANHGYNMPNGWSMTKIKSAGLVISQDVASNNFNLASLLDGDTRTYPLRYVLLTNGKNPQGVDDYPNARILYVVSSNKRRVMKTDVWELSAMGPSKIVKEWSLGDGIILYRLEKTND